MRLDGIALLCPLQSTNTSATRLWSEFGSQESLTLRYVMQHISMKIGLLFVLRSCIYFFFQVFAELLGYKHNLQTSEEAQPIMSLKDVQWSDCISIYAPKIRSIVCFTLKVVSNHYCQRAKIIYCVSSNIKLKSAQCNPFYLCYM